MEKTQLLSAAYIKAEAVRLGFSACGLSPAGAVNAAHTGFFRQWLARGCQAGMAYMENHEALRLDPRKLMEGCHTVVSLAMSYVPANPAPDDRLQLSWYVYGKDYHDVVRDKLHRLLSTLQTAFPAAEGRVCCDTAPVLERYWAWQCGIGWIGHHTQLVIPYMGSAFFLGEILLNLPADQYDAPMDKGCGNCTRCRDACPTHALTPEGLDARRCLSYLTIENRGEIPAEAATKMFPYFYGCDRCLRACPHLRTATPTTEEAFAPSSELQTMTDADWLHLDVEQYRRLFKGSAVKRAKYEGLARNLAAIQTNITTKKEI